MWGARLRAQSSERRGHRCCKLRFAIDLCGPQRGFHRPSSGARVCFDLCVILCIAFCFARANVCAFFRTERSSRLNAFRAVVRQPKAILGGLVAFRVVIMFRASVSVVLCCCSGVVVGVQPLLNVIAEPPSAIQNVDSADAFDEVSVVAGALARHAVERQEALDESVGAMLASQAPTSSSAKGTRPLALLEEISGSVAGGTPELHIQPPVQDDADVLTELDGIMQAEQAKRKLADEIFSGGKQRMLDIERAELRRIIRDVFT